MKFLDLNTGYSFDALWTDEQQKGYIFWFPKEQSIGITYTMPIAVITDSPEPLTISIETNDVFSFITKSNTQQVIDGYTFDSEPIYLTQITTEPEEINGKYIHLFNVAATAQNANEYVCKITIGDKGFIRVGADFYGESESLYINLSNMGIEIPESVQKAIYDSNVHEDITDNILINRKFKELLSNYWDIIANKGSYKSLANSLEWFEWDNALNIKEIWKHQEANRTIFNDEEILPEFEDKVENMMSNFIKTTYVSLYCSLQDETDDYDIEYNPQLAQTVLKWSRNDIQLKIALLAQFFGIYFMPIHMSILHACAEDKVFTNTIKAITGAEIKHDDCFGDFNYVECNVKDNSIFKMTNVNAQVTANTVYAVKYPNTEDFFGVDVFTDKGLVDDNNIKTFASQYYGGPGVIIPIELTIPNQASNDFIKQTIVDVCINNECKRLTFYDILKSKYNSIKFNFNFLAKEAANYELRFTFILASSKTITRTIKFSVEDADNLNINVYKVCAKDDSNGLTKFDFTDMSCSKYLFKIQNGNANKQYSQYLPYMLPSDERYTDYKGIKLTRTVIVDLQGRRGGHVCSDHEILFIRSVMMNDYLEFAKYEYDSNGNPIIGIGGKPVMSFLIFVSKKFYAELPNAVNNNVFGYNFDIIRNDLGFYPQFHYLEKMDGNSIDNYTISPYEAVCCAAEINNGKVIEDFRYGHMINEAEWSFNNHLTNEVVINPTSSAKPFAIKSTTEAMNPGYYDISFKYSLINGTTSECKLNSAFRIK